MSDITPIFEALEKWLPEQDDHGADARRLFHGRGRVHPGWEQVTIDWFDPVLLVTLFAELPLADEAELRSVLLEVAGRQAGCALAVQRRYERDAPMELLLGDLPRKPVAQERGLKFGLQLGGRQNTGFFLDMAEARNWLADRARDKRVLNLFAYTCAFSVVARAGGARQVVNLDMSSGALRQGQQNHQRNGITDGVSYLGHDLFRSWGKLRRQGPFDRIVVDPPTRQPGSFVAEKDYHRVLAKLPGLCAPGAELLLCLNSPHLGSDFLLELVADYAPQLQFRQRLPNPAPFVDINPELGLKVLHFSYCESR